MLHWSNVRGLLFSIPLLLLSAGSAHGQARQVQEPGILAFTPADPRPGAIIQVAYEAPGWLGAGREAVLRARLRTPDDQSYGEGVDTRSVARLQRNSDGIYRGQFVYPDSVVFALFAVSASDGDAVDTNLRQGWALLTYGSNGRPLAEALDQQMKDLTGRDFRQGVRVAQRRTAEYPDDPQGWYLLSFFEDQSSETDSARAAMRADRVRAFDRTLTVAPNPDAVAGLIWLAGAMGNETTQRWTDWLIERAPTHPTAVQFRSIQARQKYRTRPDSLLLVLDGLWNEAGPVYPRLTDTGLQTALAAGDADAAICWAARKVRAQPWAASFVAAQLAAAPKTREAGIARLRVEVDRVSEAPDDERDLFSTVAEHRDARRAETARLQAALGAALLAKGDAAGALGPLEAAATDDWDTALLRNVATARLARADSLGAARMLARVAADPGVAADSVRAQGLRLVGSEAWSGLVREAADSLRSWTLRPAFPTYLPQDVTVLDVEGDRVPLQAVLGDGPTVMVLYSQYCGYCVAATPRIEALRGRLEAAGTRVVVISAEPPGVDSEAFFAKLGYKGAVYHDVNREAALAFGSAGVPAYFVLDQTGAVRFRFTSLDEVPSQVAALLPETEPQVR